MRLISHIRRVYWSSLFRVSKRQTRAGIEVGVFFPDTDKESLIEEKLADAFALLGAHGPKYLSRIRSLADGILVLGTVGALGSWNKDARLVRLSQDFITDPATKPVDVAGTMVHEATHAWLDHLGFPYAPRYRARIEAICYRAQSIFAARIPGCDHVALEYEQRAQLVLHQPDDEWSDEAFHLRAAEHFIELGLPQWLARRLSRFSSVLPNERCS